MESPGCRALPRACGGVGERWLVLMKGCAVLSCSACCGPEQHVVLLRVGHATTPERYLVQIPEGHQNNVGTVYVGMDVRIHWSLGLLLVRSTVYVGCSVVGVDLAGGSATASGGAHR